MRRTRPDIARLALHLLIAVTALCKACGAARSIEQPLLPPETVLVVATVPPTAMPTPDPLHTDFTLTVTAQQSLRTAPSTVSFLARVTGPDHPGCVGHQWSFGDGNGWGGIPGCVSRTMLTPIPAAPVTTEYTIAHTYLQRGTYRVEFCLTRSGCVLSATTTVIVY